MAIVSGFYNSVNGDRKYDAEDFGRLLNGVIQQGVFANVGNQFLCTSNRNGMSVRIDTGKAWVGSKYIELTSFETVNISPAHPSYDRKDYICLLVNNNASARAGSVTTIPGTPAPKGPQVKPPQLPSWSGFSYLPIAMVDVYGGATSISNAEITNLAGTSTCPWVSGPNMTVNVDGLQNQLQSKFDTWFASVRDALNKAAGGNVNVDIANLKTDMTATKDKLERTVRALNSWVGDINNINAKMGNRNTIYEMLDQGNAGIHNSIWRGDHLGTTLSTDQQAAIRNGTFKGIYVGDYWTIWGVQWRVAGFDYWRNIGPSAWDRPHMILIPDTSLVKAPWGTGSTSDGYMGSLLFKKAPAISSTIDRLRAMFGSNLNSPWHRVSNGAEDGLVTSWAWEGTSQAALLTERMLFGQPVQSYAQSYTQRRYDFSVAAQGQLPMFRLNPQFITSAKEAIWLQDIANASSAFFLDSTGIVNAAPVTYSYGVRPYVVITS